jgi:hypothetical protein
MKMVHIYLEAEIRIFYTAYLIVVQGSSHSWVAYTYVSKVHCVESTYIRSC